MHYSVFGADETPYHFYGDGKGNLVWECKYCNRKLTSAARVYQHCRREVYKERMAEEKTSCEICNGTTYVKSNTAEYEGVCPKCSSD